MGDFKRDLKRAIKSEEYICEQLKEEFPDIMRIEGYNPGYDLESPYTGYRAEVKYDQESQKTGNVVIEFECDGKPSGIETTTAIDWFIIYYLRDDMSWVYARIRTTELKHFLKVYSKYLKEVEGGDDNLSKMWLMSCQLLANQFPYTKIK